jgi:hypothetical protein
MRKPKPKFHRFALTVELLEAKPNPMFTEWQRQATRFLRYSKYVPCAECGKKAKVMWTQLFSFRCMDKGSFIVAQFTGKIHPPLTPVCGDHPLGPVFEDDTL